jgi:uncharacterized OB-fold protein
MTMDVPFGWIDLCPHTKLAGFAGHLREGRLVASRCSACGDTSFPPRADCARCRAAEFEFVEIERRGRVVTFTTIAAAPAGFEDVAPYTLGVVDLRGGGRLLAWFGESLPEKEIGIGIDVEVVPRVREGSHGARLVLTLERPRDQEAGS